MQERYTSFDALENALLERLKARGCSSRDRFKFCVNVKTDIRFMNSYKWAEPIF